MKKNSWQEIEILVKEAQMGNKDSMEKLMKSFENYIYKSAMTIYVSGYDQDDLMQIGYMTVMRAVEKYDITKSNFVNYVTLAITNNFRCLIRNKAKENAVGSLDLEFGDGLSLGDMLQDETVNVEEDYIIDELRQVMKEAIDGLPFKLQEVITYVYLEEKGTCKDYAKEKKINYNTVIKRKNLAFAKLKKALQAR